MKKSILFSIAMLLALSCTVMDNEEEQPSVHTMTVTAVSDGPDARAELGSGNSILWENGDRIGISYTDQRTGSIPLELVSGEGTRNGVFQGEVYDTNRDYLALYPYRDEDHFYYEDHFGPEYYIIHWSGRMQRATRGSFDRNAALMLAKSSFGNSTLYFRHVCAYLKFTIDFPCRIFSVMSNGGEPLNCSELHVAFDDAGSYYVDDYAGLPVITEMLGVSEDNSRVALLPEEGEEYFIPGTYLIAVLPGTLEKGFTINVQDADTDKVYSKVVNKTAVFQRGHILNIGELDRSSLGDSHIWNGSGTASDPYQIESKLQFLEFVRSMSRTGKDGYDGLKDKHFIQLNDIDLGGEVLDPIGRSKPFMGTYDGGGHKLVDYYIYGDYPDLALFASIYNATIRNLTLTPHNIIQSTTKNFEEMNISPLVARATSSESGQCLIENVTVAKGPDSQWGQRVNYISDDSRVNYGGIVAFNEGNLKIVRCTNHLDFHCTPVSPDADFDDDSKASAGGIVGYAYLDDFDGYLVIDRCRNTAVIDAKNVADANAGGIVGYLYECSFSDDVVLWASNCVNSGGIKAVSYDGDSYAGGIVGCQDSDGYGSNDPHVYNSLNKGWVDAKGDDDSYIGGLSGYCYDSDTKFFCCASIGLLYGDEDDSDMHMGILSGYNGKFDYCYWDYASMIVDSEDEDDCSGLDNCGGKNPLDASFMNGVLSKLHAGSGPTAGISYCQWHGTSADHSLDIYTED